MIPTLNGIDHIHLYVPNREEAAKWYEETLGFSIVDDYRFWAKDIRGPLTISDPSDRIHFALFQRENPALSSHVAFGATGAEFLKWKAYLEAQGILDRLSDHTTMWSLYFHDPFGNNHEITTGDYDLVANAV